MPAYMAIAAWQRPRTSPLARRAQGLLGEHDRGGLPLSPIVDLRQRQQCMSEDVSRRQVPSQLLEHRGGALEVAGVVQVLGQLEPQLVDGRASLRDEAESEVGQLGRRVGCAPAARPVSRTLDDVGDPGVPVFAGQGEMARDLLGVADYLCKRTVDLPATVAWRRRIHRGSEERVHELDPPVGPDADEPRLLRSGERLRVDQAEVGSRQRRRAQQRVAGSRRQRPDAVCDERLEAVGNRQPRTALDVPGEQPRDLERVQRVAGRRLRDPYERRARKRPLESLAQRRGAAPRPKAARARACAGLPPARCGRVDPPNRSGARESPGPARLSVAGSRTRSRRLTAGRATGRRRLRARPPDRRPARGSATARRSRPDAVPAVGPPRHGGGRRRARDAAAREGPRRARARPATAGR